MKTKDHLLMEDAYNQVTSSQMQQPLTEDQIDMKYDDLVESVSIALKNLQQFFNSPEWENHNKDEGQANDMQEFLESLVNSGEY